MTQVAIKNIDLGKTQITDKIRVSSAAIWYESWYGSWYGGYYQYETFVFSNDKEAQKSIQVIHGTYVGGTSSRLLSKTKKIHKYIADNLIQKFQCPQCKGEGSYEGKTGSSEGIPEADVMFVCNECGGSGKIKKI